ncbi:MAG: ABC transporter substrate binding protein [Candidatus Thiodiazotropha sp.]
MTGSETHSAKQNRQGWVCRCALRQPVIEKTNSSLVISLFVLVIFFLSFFLTPGIVASQNNYNNILILLSDNKDVYLDVATTITNSTIKYCRNHGLSCQNSNYDIVHISSYEQQIHKNYKAIITLGTHAAIISGKNIQDITIISALIPKNNVLIQENLKANPNQHFLYLDQPQGHSLALIKALSSRFEDIGIVVDSKDQGTVESLQKAALRLKLNLLIEQIFSDEQVGAALNNLLERIDILLTTPDTNIHNKSTVSNILLSTYRKRIPLIGFSSAYVKAGALAAVYSSPEDIAYQVRDNIIAYFGSKQLPLEQQMGKYFSVLFNTDVARSLGFPIKSESKLKSRMMDYIRHDFE